LSTIFRKSFDEFFASKENHKSLENDLIVHARVNCFFRLLRAWHMRQGSTASVEKVLWQRWLKIA
jgi:hypothetical protein